MMLNDAPELLPGGDDRRPVVVVEESRVSVGEVDLVAVGPTGSITVVECKLGGRTARVRWAAGAKHEIEGLGVSKRWAEVGPGCAAA